MNVTLKSCHGDARFFAKCIKSLQRFFRTYSPIVSFENGFIALVWIKSISLCWKLFPFWAGWNEYDAEKLLWRRTIFRKTIKICNDFSWLFPVCQFKNGYIALVWIKCISLCWKIFPFWAGWNEYDAEKLSWQRTIFRKKHEKFVTTIHDFFPICQLWKWVRCIGMNKIYQSVLRKLSGCTRKNYFCGWNDKYF